MSAETHHTTCAVTDKAAPLLSPMSVKHVRSSSDEEGGTSTSNRIHLSPLKDG